MNGVSGVNGANRVNTTDVVTGGPRLIVGVVTRGQADRHVGAAIRAGAQAATVFVGRGTDAEQQVGKSGLAMRSEKEIIVAVVGPEIADDVMRAMRAAGAQGESQPTDYIAKMPVSRVVGLLEAVALAAGAEEKS